MRSIFFSILFSLCILSCNKVSEDTLFSSAPQLEDYLIETRSANSISSTNHRISEEHAAGIVRNRFPDKRLVSLEKVRNQSKVVLYVADFEDGWALISADDRADVILAFSEHGSFDPNDIPNPGARFWFDSIQSEIASLSEDNCTPLAASEGNSERGMRPRWFWVKTRILDSLVCRTYFDSGHLMSTTWGQNNPWNNDCPMYSYYGYYVHCLTGCVATAMSQILYFSHYELGKPNSLYHTVGYSNPYLIGPNNTFFRSDYTGISPRWDDMPLDKTGTNSNYVADLMIDVGDRVNMEYYPSASYSSTRAYAKLAFFSYGILCDTSSYSRDIVLTSLRNGMPVMVRADNEFNNGHAWVIDGIRENNDLYAYEDIWHLIYATDPGLDILEFYSPEQMAIIDPNMYDGKTESGTYETHSDTFILMNWGYDDNYTILSYNDVYYSPWNNASWANSNSTYSGDKFIVYNFR